MNSDNNYDDSGVEEAAMADEHNRIAEWACCHWPGDAARLRTELERLNGLYAEYTTIGCCSGKAYSEWPVEYQQEFQCRFNEYANAELERLKVEQAEHIDISPVEGCGCALCKARSELEKAQKLASDRLDELEQVKGERGEYFVALEESILEREKVKGEYVKCRTYYDELLTQYDALVFSTNIIETDLAASQQQNRKLKEVLLAIANAYGVGRFTTNSATIACNYVNDLRAIARDALQEPVDHIGEATGMMVEKDASEG